MYCWSIDHKTLFISMIVYISPMYGSTNPNEDKISLLYLFRTMFCFRKNTWNLVRIKPTIGQQYNAIISIFKQCTFHLLSAFGCNVLMQLVSRQAMAAGIIVSTQLTYLWCNKGWWHCTNIIQMFTKNLDVIHQIQNIQGDNQWRHSIHYVVLY